MFAVVWQLSFYTAFHQNYLLEFVSKLLNYARGKIRSINVLFNYFSLGDVQGYTWQHSGIWPISSLKKHSWQYSGKIKGARVPYDMCIWVSHMQSDHPASVLFHRPSLLYNFDVAFVAALKLIL